MTTIGKNAIEIAMFRESGDFKKFIKIIHDGDFVQIEHNIYKKITFLEYLKYKRMASYLEGYEIKFLFLEDTCKAIDTCIEFLNLKNTKTINKETYLFYIYDSNRYGVILIKEKEKIKEAV